MAAPVASEAGISAAQAVAGEENSREDAVADEPNEGVDEAKFDIIGVHGFHGDENIWDGAYTSSGQDPTRLNKLFSNIAPKGGRFISYSYDPDDASMGCYTLQGSYRNAHKLLEVVAKSRTPEIRVCLATLPRGDIYINLQSLRMQGDLYTLPAMTLAV